MEILGTLFLFLISIIIGIFVIAEGIKWGGLWLLRAISRNDELTEWLKHIFSKREES